jgi:hypothetical protein
MAESSPLNRGLAVIEGRCPPGVGHYPAPGSAARTADTAASSRSAPHRWAAGAPATRADTRSAARPGLGHVRSVQLAGMSMYESTRSPASAQPPADGASGTLRGVPKTVHCSLWRVSGPGQGRFAPPPRPPSRPPRHQGNPSRRSDPDSHVGFTGRPRGTSLFGSG